MEPIRRKSRGRLGAHCIAWIVLCAAATGVSRGAEPADLRFAYQPVKDIGKEPGVCRRDPSDVIRVGDLHYVWYSRVDSSEPLYPSGYRATVWYAVSRDNGHTWEERGEALGRGPRARFDSTAVFTPNILALNNKYYLYYTAVGDDFDNRGYSDKNRTAIGVAVSDSPDGPWKARARPILESTPAPARFDSFRVDDACLLVKGNEVWLYYKGRQWKNTPANTRMGVAVADHPEGPFVRRNQGNPIQDSGHEVQVWEQDGGVYSMVSPSGPRGNTLRWARDGLDFDKTILARFSPRAPMAPGLFRPELTGEQAKKRSRWGISMATYGKDPYLHRFTFTPPAREAME